MEIKQSRGEDSIDAQFVSIVYYYQLVTSTDRTATTTRGDEREREKVGRTGPTDGWTVIDFNRVENTGERGGKASCRRARTRDGNLSAPLTDEDEEDSP